MKIRLKNKVSNVAVRFAITKPVGIVHYAPTKQRNLPYLLSMHKTKLSSNPSKIDYFYNVIILLKL